MCLSAFCTLHTFAAGYCNTVSWPTYESLDAQCCCSHTPPWLCDAPQSPPLPVPLIYFLCLRCLHGTAWHVACCTVLDAWLAFALLVGALSCIVRFCGGHSGLLAASSLHTASHQRKTIQHHERHYYQDMGRGWPCGLRSVVKLPDTFAVASSAEVPEVAIVPSSREQHTPHHHLAWHGCHLPCSWSLQASETAYITHPVPVLLWVPPFRCWLCSNSLIMQYTTAHPDQTAPFACKQSSWLLTHGKGPILLSTMNLPWTQRGF
jgi:hypothetical protein